MKIKSSPLEDKQLAARLRRSIAHFGVDMTGFSLTYRNGTVYMSGALKSLGRENQGQDLRKMLEQMVEALKTNPGVREVHHAYLRIIY